MLAVTRVLLGDPLIYQRNPPFNDRSTAKTISDVRRAHAHHWKCFHTNETSLTWTPTSHRTSNAATQKKRKRKDSDGEYIPHQKPDNNSSASSAVRRTSKRLAAFAEPERPSSTRTHLYQPIFTTKRSSSSTSALTSTSSSSFERLPTPKDPDASDLLPSASGQEESLEDYGWDFSSVSSCSPPPTETRTFTSLGVGFPSKGRVKKVERVHNYPSMIEVRGSAPPVK